jgi:short-subunit dehydrogenase
LALPPPAPNSIALVTGASSGIGVELARGLARRGHSVALVARRTDALERLAAQLRTEHDVRALVYGCDLGDVDERTTLLEKIDASGFAVEILVNNAGFGWVGRFEDGEVDHQLQLVRVNAEAPVHLCAHFIPPMVERGRGGVLNLASIAGFAPLPGMTTYSAAKAFIISFTQALRAELRGTGVTATVLAPGGVKTEFGPTAGGQDIENRIPDFAYTDVTTVAEAGINGLERGKRMVVPGALYKLGSRISHHAPRGPLLRVASFRPRH